MKKYTRKHVARKSATRKHSTRKHSTRKIKSYGGAKKLTQSVDRCAVCGQPIVGDSYVIKNQKMYHEGCINTGTKYKGLKKIAKDAGVTK